jgi:hypothetical protein
MAAVAADAVVVVAATVAIAAIAGKRALQQRTVR